MIVVDTSALMAILLAEPDAELCEDAIAEANGLLISAGTLTEAYVVAARRGFSEDMVDLVRRLKFQVVPVDVAFAEAAGRLCAIWQRLACRSFEFRRHFLLCLGEGAGLPASLHRRRFL